MTMPGPGIWAGFSSPFPLSTSQPYWPEPASATVDATGEALHLTGQVHIDGRPTSAKTLSAAGGGSITFRTYTSATWANAGTILRVGVQDIDAAGGAPARGDGTFDVYGDLVPGTDSLSANAWITATMGSGSKSIAHGDIVAIVIEMNARGGADSVSIYGPSVGNLISLPGSAFYTGTYAASSVGCNGYITFDDGTLGWINIGTPVGCIHSSSSESFSDSTNPDERGAKFRMPFDCKVDAMALWNVNNAANNEWVAKIYSDPAGTPTAEGTFLTFEDYYRQGASTTYRVMMMMSPQEVVLRAGVDYVAALKATGTANTSLATSEFVATSLKKSIPLFGENISFVTRNNGSGAFGSEVTTKVPQLSLRLTDIFAVAPGFQLGI